MIYYSAPHEFTESEIRPAQTIATQVAFALQRQKAEHALEKLVNERTASLREAIAQMEEFSYSVSHDLRAPVRAMQGYARAVREDWGIQDILIYSRLSRREIDVQAISLDRLIREIIQQYPEMQQPQAHVEIMEPLQDVIAHEASLSQAVSNLLSNAVKFVSPGKTPRVQIRTERLNGDVRLFVKDHGIGIKPEYQHRLFSLFERIHPEKVYEGTGIGLAIVRKAAERMGGKAGFESDGVNGSCFWIQLPAAKVYGSEPNPASH
jgi:signal transduction histidine kinase